MTSTAPDDLQGKLGRIAHVVKVPDELRVD